MIYDGSLRDAQLDCINTLTAGGVMQFRSGTMPARTDEPDVGDLLVEFTLGLAWLRRAAPGVASLSQPLRGTAIQTGEPGYFRVKDSSAGRSLIQGTIGMQGADMFIEDSSIEEGQDIALNQFDVIAGNASGSVPSDSSNARSARVLARVGRSREQMLAFIDTLNGHDMVYQVWSGAMPASVLRQDEGELIAELPLPPGWLAIDGNETYMPQEVEGDACATGVAGYFRIGNVRTGVVHLQGNHDWMDGRVTEQGMTLHLSGLSLVTPDA